MQQETKIKPVATLEIIEEIFLNQFTIQDYLRKEANILTEKYK